jgi:hypothetical protein
MAQAVFSGPLISLGPLAGGQRGSQPVEYSDEIGPSLLWNGAGLPLGNTTGSKDRKGQGAIRAALMSDTICAVNQIMATGGAALTTAANAVTGTPLVNVTAIAAGIGANLAVYGKNGTLVSNAVGIDPGFATVTTVASSATVTIAATDSWRFVPGNWYCFAGGGAGGTTLFARCVSVAGTAMVISANAGASSSLVQVGFVAGNPNAYGWAPIAYSNSQPAGTGRFFNPDCGAARGVGVTGVASGTGGNVLIEGLDEFLQYTSETIAATAGATTVYGKKTYKIFLGATPQFSDAHNYTVVTSDLVGLPLVLINDGFAPTVLSAGTAYTTSVPQYGDLTSPATLTTGDPRGAIQLSAKGPNGGASGGGPTGSARFTIFYQLNPAQVFLASPTQYQILYGVLPA